MNSMKMQVLNELMDKLSGMRGMGLKDLMEKKKSTAGVGIEHSEPDGDEMPKGVKVQSVEVMGEPDEDEIALNDSPSIDPRKAKEIQDSAMESGFQPDRWKKNLKEGLGMGKKDTAMANPELSDMDDDELEELLRRFG